MIRRVLSALAGPLLPYAAGAVAALLIALGAAWWVQTWRLEAAEARLADLRGDLAEARAAIAARESVLAALERQAEAVAAAAARLDPIRRDVNAAPRTTGCLDSPAVRAGLERLRTTRPGAAGAGPGPEPADLPARTAGP